MQRLFLALLILIAVQNGQAAKVAIANIHVDSTTAGIGTILFHQDDPQQPVRIAGIIDGLKPNTVHVSFVIPTKDNQCTALFRVFMYIEIHCQKATMFAMPLVLISIPKVR